MFQAVLTDRSGRVVISQGDFPTREDARQWVGASANQEAQSDCSGHWSIEPMPCRGCGGSGYISSVFWETGECPEPCPDCPAPAVFTCPHCGHYDPEYGGRDCPSCGSN